MGTGEICHPAIWTELFTCAHEQVFSTPLLIKPYHAHIPLVERVIIQIHINVLESAGNCSLHCKACADEPTMSTRPLFLPLFPALVCITGQMSELSAEHEMCVSMGLDTCKATQIASACFSCNMHHQYHVQCRCGHYFITPKTKRLQQRNRDYSVCMKVHCILVAI